MNDVGWGSPGLEQRFLGLFVGVEFSSGDEGEKGSLVWMAEHETRLGLDWGQTV